MSKKHKKLLKTLGYRSDRFLNSESKRMIPFTSSVTCYFGDGYNCCKNKEQTCFVEIADCHSKVRLHPNGMSKESLLEFAKKLELLAHEVNAFSIYLLEEFDPEEKEFEKEEKYVFWKVDGWFWVVEQRMLVRMIWITGLVN